MAVPSEIKRYTVRLVSVMTLYAVVLVGVNLWFRHAPPHGVLAYVAAMLPALPIAGVFVVIGRLVMEMRDEYLRAQFVRHLLIATGVTLSITTAWGFLEGFGLAPHAAGYYAATIWFSIIGVMACAGSLMTIRAARAGR